MYPRLNPQKKLLQILKRCCRHTVISWTAMRSTMIRRNWMCWNTWCTKREISSVCWSYWNRLNPPQKTKLLYRQRHKLGSKWGQSKFCGIAKWCEKLEKPPHFKWNTVVLWLRERDLNPRPPGYELQPDWRPFLYLGINLFLILQYVQPLFANNPALQNFTFFHVYFEAFSF